LREGGGPEGAVEGAVDLDRGELAAGIGQLARLRQARRVEVVAPGLESPATDADTQSRIHEVGLQVPQTCCSGDSTTPRRGACDSRSCASALMARPMRNCSGTSPCCCSIAPSTRSLPLWPSAAGGQSKR